MPLNEDFDQLNGRERGDLVRDVQAYFAEAANRHKEITGRLDLLLGALAAGARAFADEVSRGIRR